MLPALSVVAVAVSLAACDGSSSSSSSSSSSMLESQAIDGWIVGGTVMCDGAPNGETQAMGALECPNGTVLVKVSNGIDVGFDEIESNDKPFVGQLLAPADLGFVTPLSSIAVAMSGGENGFDASAFGNSVTKLGQVLGFDGELDLGADPASEENVKLAALNAKINQVVSAFSSTADDHLLAGEAFAAYINDAEDGATIDITADVQGIMNAVNARLPSTQQLETAELDAKISEVAAVNAAIDVAKSPADIGNEVSKSPVATPALTLKRDDTLLRYYPEGVNAPMEIDLDSFEDDTLMAGNQYATVIDGSGVLSVDKKSFTVGKDLDDKRVDLGFSVVSTDDSNDDRVLSVATTEARVSADKGIIDSLVVTMPAGSKVFVGSTSKGGDESTATITLKKAHSFSLDSGEVDVSFWRISDELEENGLDDITSEDGNYRMTVAIGGVRIGETEGGISKTATTHSVAAGNLTVSGPGFVGYVSFTPDPK